MPRKLVPLSFRVLPGERDAVRELSKRTGVPQSVIFRKALLLAVERFEDNVDENFGYGFLDDVEEEETSAP